MPRLKALFARRDKSSVSQLSAPGPHPRRDGRQHRSSRLKTKRLEQNSCGPVTRAQVPLMRLAASKSVTEQRSTGHIGLPDPTMALPFPADLRGISSLPSPVPFRIRVHPLKPWPPLQSPSYLSPACQTEVRQNTPPQGLLLVATSPFESTTQRLPRPPSFRPRRFTRPRRVTPRMVCGLISSHCHVQDSRFRGFPSDSA
jgi:hypothetical protein